MPSIKAEQLYANMKTGKSPLTLKHYMRSVRSFRYRSPSLPHIFRNPGMNRSVSRGEDKRARSSRRRDYTFTFMMDDPSAQRTVSLIYMKREAKPENTRRPWRSVRFLLMEEAARSFTPEESFTAICWSVFPSSISIIRWRRIFCIFSILWSGEIIRWDFCAEFPVRISCHAHTNVWSR